MKVFKTILATFGATLFVGTTILASNFDVQAQAKTYDVHTVYNGHSINVEHDGEIHEYIVENDVLTYTAMKISSGVCYDKMPEDLWKTVQPDTLVYVRFSDMGTDDVSDDVPVLIGYDTIGMNRRVIEEIDAWLANK